MRLEQWNEPGNFNSAQLMEALLVPPPALMQPEPTLNLNPPHPIVPLLPPKGVPGPYRQIW